MALTEFHDIVYREAPRAGRCRARRPRRRPRRAWEERWVPDDVLLFRYSALTFNGHRIHYDRRYVTEVEGYPGLIVHGPLIATLLLDLLRHERPDAVVARYEFRAVRPMFDINHFFVCGEPQADGKSFRLWARTTKAGWRWTRPPSIQLRTPCDPSKASPSSRSSTRSPRRSRRANWPISARASSRSSGRASGDFARGYDERVRGLASHFVWTNRSKESLTLDVKHPEAQTILQRLILEQADVARAEPGARRRGAPRAVLRRAGAGQARR